MFKDTAKEKEELYYSLQRIPQRILDLQLEIDELKLKYKEHLERYNELHSKHLKDVDESLKKVKIISKKDWLDLGWNKLREELEK